MRTDRRDVVRGEARGEGLDDSVVIRQVLLR
jgi:hypothetical protein